MNTVLIGVFIYIFAQLLIGVVASRRIKNEADYLLAGRSFGYGLASFSIFATWFGAETVVGSAGKMYEEGLSGAAADPFGYALCLILVGLFFAVPLWRRGLTTKEHRKRGSDSGRAVCDDPRVAGGPDVLSDAKRETKHKATEPA